ncbi:MAG: efflux RND transporter periplasmic adaptor subunit, partial [Flavobacteriaceae bacterium]
MKKYITLLVLSFALVSCGSDDKKEAVNNTPAIGVKVSSVNAENNSPFFTASGKIKATNQITLSTRTSGYVDNIYVKVGDKVAKGKLLLSINNAD